MLSEYNLDSVFTESDVEQKLIYPLLVSPEPNGLGYSDADILTKPSIKKISIDKGKKQKLYYPDYAIILNGLPSIIIEAKSPGENLTEASREARLYATEVNSSYKRKINPCQWIIVSDGKTINTYFWDSDEPLLVLSTGNINPINQEFEKFQKLISKNIILKSVNEILKSINKNAKFHKPVHMLGGKSVINQTVGQNSFGSNVSLEYRYLFNPNDMQDRVAIVKNAYVASKRKESHISPIDKLIRAAIPQSEADATPVLDTEKPKIIIDKLSDPSRIKNEICLLIGGVGSGKSTFTDYLRSIALPDSIRDSTEWININLNKAPLSRGSIYDWIVRECILSVKRLHDDIDFDRLETLKSIYSREISKLEKGRAALFEKGSERHSEIIHDELERLQNDSTATLDAYINYLYCGTNKLFVIVLDNCDKRNRDDQLLMFEVATWLKNTFPCMVFLPLRDVTYDQYCNEPPLDTVIKDLVFRVDPPLLERVIYSRLKYALREIKSSETEFSYYLPNNSKVVCSRGEIGVYFKCIVASLFQDKMFRRIISGLAGRNIRKGLEIFLDFCKSGHIDEGLIFRIRQSEGDYHIPPHLVMRILLKGKRKYYYDKESHIKNLFHSAQEEFPDPFVRIAILRYLKSKFREYGPNKTRGYHKVEDVTRFLQMHGHTSRRILIELDALTNAGCISTESQTNELCENDLVSIAPAGFIHLDMLRDISYLSMVSEDVLFRDSQVAKKIADNITGRGKHKALGKQSDISNSVALIEYLNSYFSDYFVGAVKLIDESGQEDLVELASLKEYVAYKASCDKKYAKKTSLEEDYPPGAQVIAQIVSIQDYGIFVEFDVHGTGLIHKTNFSNVPSDYLSVCDEGDWVIAEIISFSTEHERFQLKLLGI